MSTAGASRSLGDYAGLFRRRWRYPASIIPAGVLVAVFIAYVLPITYLGSATILEEGSSLPVTMVPTTVTGPKNDHVDAAQQLELTRQRVMTEASLVELVKRVDPYPDQPGLSFVAKAKRLSADSSVERVNPVTLEPTQYTDAFSIYYASSNPKLAAAVAGGLAGLFLDYSRRDRAERAAEALRFLQSQAHELEASMQAMERRLAQFKGRYRDALPDAQNRNLTGSDRAQRDIETYERELPAAEQKVSQLELQLKDTSPSLTAAVGDWRLEIAKMRAELALDEQKYTPEHPDIKRLRRAIADLAAQGAASTTTASPHPDNPDYLQIQSQLAGARDELAALRAMGARARSDLQRFEQNLTTSPNVEREYTQLTREYNDAQSRYTDVQAKIKSAALAQTLEGESLGQRYTVIRTPTVPTKPASPNRLGIILIGVLLSGALAFALAVIIDSSDPTVRGADDLQSILKVAPMAAVPAILNRSDIRVRRLGWAAVLGVYVAAGIAVAATIRLAA